MGTWGRSVCMMRREMRKVGEKSCMCSHAVRDKNSKRSGKGRWVPREGTVSVPRPMWPNGYPIYRILWGRLPIMIFQRADERFPSLA
jgi:hypothetical protein